ncbi:CusA/CzcA family heavy metal efflux RND transporter [bacterium]|nr:CusA/CzcA family heavy metal efflux RND transporter [bacterium]
MPSPIEIALRHRWGVFLCTLALAALGAWSFARQKIDAYPDISGQMVTIITTFPGRAPEDVERQVTVPIERAMGGVPRVETIRSRTIFGLSVVQLSFEEGVDGYWARQRVEENLRGVDLPEQATPELGPLATAYGEIFRYELQSNGVADLMALRTLNDWVVIPRLIRVPGVADVSNFGGLAKQYAVTLQPAQLLRFGLTLRDVVDALRSNNADAGGSVLSRGSMSFVVRGRGALRDPESIASTFIRSIDGTPVYVRDVANVELDAKVPSGIFSKDRTDEAVEGIVLMRRGENPSQVLQRVKDAIAELAATELPDGVRIVPFYDRQHLVDETLRTVSHSVLLGIGLVVLVLVLFLGRLSLAALVALTIPFSLLFALVLMGAADIPIGLLSIGAIDFGIIVDGAVIMVDSIAHRLGSHAPRGGRRDVTTAILAAAQSVQRAIFFSMLMIIAAYLPLLTLTRIEGLLFRPMALTIVFALIGALFFALMTIPALASVVLRRGHREWDNPALRWFRPVYGAILRRLMAARGAVIAGAAVLIAGVTLLVVPRLGVEFLPYIDEGVIWVRANFPEGTSLEQTARFGARIRELVLALPDVAFVSVQTGRNDSGTDPFPPSRMEIMIGPTPRADWRQFRTKHELLEAIGSRLRRDFPTTRFNFTQPIIDSVTEDTNGTSANLAVEIQGPDPAVLQRLGQQAVDLLRAVPGAVDVNIEQEGPQPQLVIQPDRALGARYNVRIEDIQQLIDTALGGEPVAALYEGDRRFDIAVRFDRQSLSSPSAVGRLPVHTADGVPIPLAEVASIDLVDGQTTIAREGGRQRLTVRCDIVDRDQGGFVADAQARFAAAIQVPPGYRVSWLGMFENLARARAHFAVVIPATLALIYGLLVLTFRSQASALMLLLSVPFAFTGGALALCLRGMHLNVSTGVGFAALFGVSIMNGVLMVRAITALRLQGTSADEAIVQGSQQCLRPILMASLVAILGLLPASLATGLGSDVQRPLATVIVWGLFSGMTLTLFLVPVLYRLVLPALPQPTVATAEGAVFVEPLPAVAPADVVAVLRAVAAEGGESEIFRIAEACDFQFGRVVLVVKAAELLDLVDTPRHVVVLAAAGRRLVEAPPDEQAGVWRRQLLHLRLFRLVHDAALRRDDRTLDRDFVLETIVTRMPSEDYELVFNTFVRWARFGALFDYDPETHRLRLIA